MYHVYVLYITMYETTEEERKGENRKIEKKVYRDLRLETKEPAYRQKNQDFRANPPSIQCVRIE